MLESCKKAEKFNAFLSLKFSKLSDLHIGTRLKAGFLFTRIVYVKKN